MHSIQRSPEPDFLAGLRTLRSEYEQLEDGERRRVRGELARDFNRICAYCERECVEPTRRERDNEESIDHFQPRQRFPEAWLDWLNLMYSCRRCNQSKGSKWPTDGDYDNRRLASIARYQPVTEYVCPNQSDTQPRCETLFEFDLATGEIGPANGVDDFHWSLAFRTIVDIDLNSIRHGQQNLPELRQRQIELVEITLRQVDDPSLEAAIVAGFSQRSRPFSSFVLTYARSNGFVR